MGALLGQWRARLTYDCVRCNATCCRGHGFSLDASSQERDRVYERANLHIFSQVRHGNLSSRHDTITNCPPACFFLTEDGLCGIQLEHGYDQKPETCRLFPFNQFHIVGD